MRKTIFYIAIAAIATAAFIGCSKDDPKEIDVVDNSSLTQEVYADDTEGDSGVTFTTTGAWTSSISSAQTRADNTPDWISISPDHGDAAGTYTITITLTPNTTGADRTAIITISCNGTNITITITQKGENENGTTPISKGITMTAQGNIIKFQMLGSGTVTVNWGDGASEPYTLSTTVATDCGHSYTASSSRTVTISGNNITGLNCNGYQSNQLTSLDVSKNLALTILWCEDNLLTSLDVSKNVALTEFWCRTNLLSNLDVSKNVNLIELRVSENLLLNLDVSKNVKLAELMCDENRLTDTALNNLFETLHDKTISGKIIYVNNNPGSATCDVSIAENKGWQVVNY